MLLQVGGHPDTVHEQDAYIVKECTDTEALFYHETHSMDHPHASALRAWMPQCYGIADEHGEWLEGWPRVPLKAMCGTYSVTLENLVRPFCRANVCDIKIGTVLYNEANPRLSAEKRERMQRKAQETTSGSHGLRVTGYCSWDAHAQSFYTSGKVPGRAARTTDDLQRLLEAAWHVSPEVLRAHLVPRIKHLCACLAPVPVSLCSASVLVVMEGDETARQERLAHDEPIFDVRLIDFTHSRWCDQPDQGVLRGLYTLYELVLRLAAK